MKNEIDSYLTRNYYFLLDISLKYTKNKDWAHELLHEVIIQLFDREDVKVKLDDESIKSYIIRAIYINWCMPNSPFYRKYKRKEIIPIDISEINNLIYEQTDLDDHKLLEIIETEWTEIDWFNKIIFEKYMLLGSLKKVSKNTSIPLPSIGRYIKETRNKIKENTFRKLDYE